MTTSSDDGSKPNEPSGAGAKILDIRDRLPPLIFGDNEAGNLAAAICKVITERDTGAPHIWFAGLMMSSFALQRMLLEGHKISVDKLQLILEAAMELADKFQITLAYKSTKPEGE